MPNADDLAMRVLGRADNAIEIVCVPMWRSRCGRCRLADSTMAARGRLDDAAVRGVAMSLLTWSCRGGTPRISSQDKNTLSYQSCECSYINNYTEQNRAVFNSD